MVHSPMIPLSNGIFFGAANLLWIYQRTMFGPVTHEVNKSLPDLNLREYGVLLPLVALAFWIGIYPKPFFADRKSTRLNSSHQIISYAVFCLKKKKSYYLTVPAHLPGGLTT